MIKKSRLYPLFLKSDERTQRLVIKQMEFFILDNSQYTDKNNYYWLCNLLVSISFVRVYSNQNMVKSDIISIIREEMYKSVELEMQKFSEMSVLPSFIGFLNKYISKFKKKNTGYGWKVDILPSMDKECHIQVRECLIRKICNRYEMTFLIPVFCDMHSYIFGDLKGAFFVSNDLLVNGGSSCDFTIRSKNI